MQTSMPDCFNKKKKKKALMIRSYKGPSGSQAFLQFQSHPQGPMTHSAVSPSIKADLFSVPCAFLEFQ